MCNHQISVASLPPAKTVPEVYLASLLAGGGQHLCELGCTVWYSHKEIPNLTSPQLILTLFREFSIDPPSVSGVR